MRISDWSSDVCSSDLIASVAHVTLESRVRGAEGWQLVIDNRKVAGEGPAALPPGTRVRVERLFERVPARRKFLRTARSEYGACLDALRRLARSEEHTSELQSLMRTSYAVFCLTKTNTVHYCL